MGTAGSPKQLPVIKVPNVSFEFIKGYTDGRLTLDVGPVSCSLGEAQQVSVAHLKEKKSKNRFTSPDLFERLRIAHHGPRSLFRFRFRLVGVRLACRRSVS